MDFMVSFLSSFYNTLLTLETTVRWVIHTDQLRKSLRPHILPIFDDIPKCSGNIKYTKNGQNVRKMKKTRHLVLVSPGNGLYVGMYLVPSLRYVKSPYI